MILLPCFLSFAHEHSSVWSEEKIVTQGANSFLPGSKSFEARRQIISCPTAKKLMLVALIAYVCCVEESEFDIFSFMTRNAKSVTLPLGDVVVGGSFQIFLY